MARQPEIPPGARHLRTYAEFYSYILNFVEGTYRFMWVVGRPGIGKTESAKTALGARRYSYIRGHDTPLSFYRQCYEYRNAPVWLDDPEKLLSDRNGIGLQLVSCLADTSPEPRQMAWGTTSRALGDLPQRYLTTSPLLVTANRVTTHMATLSRGLILYFDPTNEEVHRATAEWFYAQEIHDWFGQQCNSMGPLEHRHYIRAFEDRQARRDWQRLALAGNCLDLHRTTVQNVQMDATRPTTAEKVAHYCELMRGVRGGSERTYHRLVQELTANGTLIPRVIPPITLRHSAPPPPPVVADLDAVAPATPAAPDETARPLDLPAPAPSPERIAFTAPVRGGTPQVPRARLDDTLPWESPIPDDRQDEMQD